MVGNRVKLLFREGVAAALTSISLSAYVIARAQSGPGWEVPVAVMEELQTIPRISMFLAFLALIFYFWSRRYGDVGATARRGFVVALLIAFVCPFVVWNFAPEQWPFQYVTLSFFASVLFVPVVIASIVAMWLIGFRWVKTR